MMIAALSLMSALLVQDDLAGQLRDLDSKVLPAEQPRMIGRDARARIEAANKRESEAWGRIATKADWEKYVGPKIQALRASLRDSLSDEEKVPADLKVRVTRSLEGEGHRVDNIVFESRPQLIVTANLYVPVPERPSMPGILIVHSHHNPKTQSELQDMGILWARLGCTVLIMDQLGHGERRQHPFVDASSYPGPYKASRQDYFFRYVTAMQLYVAGESLVGWMAWDLMRGVDLLLARRGIDRSRIILMGSVAGGGDPAAVTAAIDDRISTVIPFNFGGPQPENKYPLPEDSETSFNYAGGGSWESTRNLRLSARDGFLPWVIVGSVAPRNLVYGHEFSWDREHDPVWKRLEKISGFYGADGLAVTTGRGLLSGQPPEASHCNNIGPIHRQGIYAALQKWHSIPAPEKENQARHSSQDLLCVTPEVKLTPLHLLLQQRSGGASPPLDGLQYFWRKVLGDIDPPGGGRATAAESRKAGDVAVERLSLEVEAGIDVPLLLLLPPNDPGAKLPVVVGIAQGGKQGFLKNRSAELEELLKGGAAVCLPDLRGTGETRPGDGRGRGSEATSIAATELMLGRTLLGLRIRDLRSVLRHLRGRADLDPARVALWGDSFAPPNARDRRLEVPIDADPTPALAEPLGGLAALFGALYEDSVTAILARGGLASYRFLLHGPFCYVPFDAVVPGGACFTDLDATVTAMAARAMRFEDLVDGLNRIVEPQTLAKAYPPASLAREGPSMAWLLQRLKK
ncbi:MAG: acetylxylan esterase [Planctomycetes bacterium]|nr:acetylxylan esterase [Planctomycetota bacterium]